MTPNHWRLGHSATGQAWRPCRAHPRSVLVTAGAIPGCGCPGAVLRLWLTAGGDCSADGAEPGALADTLSGEGAESRW